MFHFVSNVKKTLVAMDNNNNNNKNKRGENFLLYFTLLLLPASGSSFKTEHNSLFSLLLFAFPFASLLLLLYSTKSHTLLQNCLQTLVWKKRRS